MSRRGEGHAERGCLCIVWCSLPMDHAYGTDAYGTDAYGTRAPSSSATRQRVVPTDRHSFVACQ